MFIIRAEVEAEAPIVLLPDANSDSFEKTLMMGKIEGRKRRGRQGMRWLDDITNSMDMGLGRLWQLGGLVWCGSWGGKESDTTE